LWSFGLAICEPIKHLTEHFSRLPGIGERTALRLTLHMLSSERELMHSMARALVQVAEEVHECAVCHMVTTAAAECSICASGHRDRSVLCIVATIQDLTAIESTHDFKGLYHVLHGTLAPMQGIGPDDLRLRTLFERLGSNSHSTIKEIIMATPPSVEGEATAIYIADQLQAMALAPKITRIASGVPVGGDLQFADRLTLSRALTLRRAF
jgi:recombination protein RecR